MLDRLGMSFKTRFWLTSIVVVFIILVGRGYTTGTFDNFLWRVHLNYTDCAMNGFGAVFCGNDLKQYEQRVNSVR